MYKPFLIANSQGPNPDHTDIEARILDEANVLIMLLDRGGYGAETAYETIVKQRSTITGGYGGKGIHRATHELIRRAFGDNLVEVLKPNPQAIGYFVAAMLPDANHVQSYIATSFDLYSQPMSIDVFDSTDTAGLVMAAHRTLVKLPTRPDFQQQVNLAAIQALPNAKIAFEHP